MKNYFKKFSIMFVMLLAIIGIGIIQDGTIANAANVGITQLKSPESGWTRIDDTDDLISYSEDWLSPKIDGYYNSTLHYSWSSGNTLNFKFYGTKLRIIGDIYNNKSSNISIKIDTNIESFNEYNENLAQVQTIVYEKQNLPLTTHTVTITTNDSSNVVIDAVDINDTGKIINSNESITLDKSSVSLAEGDSQQLTATTTPEAVGVTWTSSDESIATVDSNGKVTAIGAGTATITATTTDGSNLSTSCIINVTPKGTNPNPNPNPTSDPQITGTDNIVNIAHAKGTNTNNPGGDVTIIFHGTADTTLSVVKTADVKDVWVGDTFTYTIVVTNTGTKTAKAVVVNDPAPNHIDFVVNGVTTTQGTIDSTSTSKNIIVNVGDIPPLGTVTIKVPATVIL